MTKPAIPQGMRDFSAETVRKRNHIFSVIRSVFEIYGFEPLETPAMENLETLLGKYGDEGDRLIFKVLNNGLNDPKNIDKARQGFEKLLAGNPSTELTERALKYDLTIPFARYVAMNHTKLTFPFIPFFEGSGFAIVDAAVGFITESGFAAAGSPVPLVVGVVIIDESVPVDVVSLSLPRLQLLKE